MSRQYFVVEVDPVAGIDWNYDQTAMLARRLGVSERQIIVVEGARVHAIEVKEPGEGKK